MPGVAAALFTKACLAQALDEPFEFDARRIGFRADDAAGLRPRRVWQNCPRLFEPAQLRQSGSVSQSHLPRTQWDSETDFQIKKAKQHHERCHT
jgi:hypothetical protein